MNLRRKPQLEVPGSGFVLAVPVSRFRFMRDVFPRGQKSAWDDILIPPQLIKWQETRHRRGR